METNNPILFFRKKSKKTLTQPNLNKYDYKIGLQITQDNKIWITKNKSSSHFSTLITETRESIDSTEGS